MRAIVEGQVWVGMLEPWTNELLIDLASDGSQRHIDELLIVIVAAPEMAHQMLPAKLTGLIKPRLWRHSLLR